MTPVLAPYPNRARIEGYARSYNLCLPERHKAARAGELAGKRTGSSIEYQDRKDYVPGDDVRHVDWRAFARNDRLTIKLYREEISPRVDIVVDASRSMSVTDEKSKRRLDLGYLFFLLAQKRHAVTALHAAGARVETLRHPFDLFELKDSSQETPLPLVQNAPFARRGGVKILVSDFLFPFAPNDVLRAFPLADRIVLVQLLSEFEDNPEATGDVRLEDAESADYLDVPLNKAVVAGYARRLNTLKSELDRQMRISEGAFVSVRDTDSLDETARALLVGGIIEA